MSLHYFRQFSWRCANGDIRKSIGKRRASTATSRYVTVRSALSENPMPYYRGWVWQHVLLERRLNYMRSQTTGTNPLGSDTQAGDRDWLLLFEHESVYTLGRGASEEHLTFLNTQEQPEMFEHELRRLSRKYRGHDASRLSIDKSNMVQQFDYESDQQEVNTLIELAIQNNPIHAPNGAPIYRIERGGEVTYHGPGQLVLYPMLNLRNTAAYEQDLHWYLRQVEEVIIQTLLRFGINSNRDDINTGVWVGMDKIAAVGVSSSRWITTHGCALNVKPDLSHFEKSIITPCGIDERGVTSMLDILGNACPSVDEVSDVAVECFGKVFDVDIRIGDQIC
jgi:lipoyl(octanoyl) transferase